MAKRKKSRLEKEKKECTKCKELKTIDKFYNSTSPMFEGKVAICSDCVNDMIDYDDINTIYHVLQMLDIPFIKEVWERVEDKHLERTLEGKNYNIFGNYKRQLSTLKQFKKLGWKDSDFGENKVKIEDVDEDDKPRELTLDKKRELKATWGDDWKLEELILLDKTYKELSADKNMRYNSSKQYMKLACMNYVRSQMAIKNGNTNEAKTYTELFNTTMKMGEFTPSALASNSNLENLGSFSEFSLMVEECIDVMNIQEILPEYMEGPRDKADKVIWYMINYMQDSLGYKRSSYEDIYSFYTQMEADYLGISVGEFQKQYPKSSTLNDFLDEVEEVEYDDEGKVVG